MRGKQKELMKYVRELENRGYTVERSKHHKVFWNGHLVTVLSNTYAGGRALANAKAIIARWEREHDTV